MLDWFTFRVSRESRKTFRAALPVWVGLLSTDWGRVGFYVRVGERCAGVIHVPRRLDR